MSPPRQVGRSAGFPSPSSPFSSGRMETLAIPSQASRRPGASPRQISAGSTAGSLRLPSLPRFHPANFPSSQSSSQGGTPMTGPNSPQPPISPRAIQKQMLMYHREILGSTPARSQTGTPKPRSPKLYPTGSPGPVTPLELEGSDGYLGVGITTGDAASQVDKLIMQEAKRRGELSPTTHPTSVYRR